MIIENNKFYVVSTSTTKLVEADKLTAIKKLVELVNQDNKVVEDSQPEIIEVDTTEDKWQLKGLSWNVIALELMKLNHK